jgi:NAD(P)-dependent dehydrogenase (short-subunit alcohol dehydrogenase family)
LPNLGLYCATKYTLRGISEALRLEVAPLGLRSTCIDFGYFRTTLLDPNHRKPYVPRIKDYNEMSKKADDALVGGSQRSVISMLVADIIRVTQRLMASRQVNRRKACRLSSTS